jgi:type III secretion protein C
MFPLKYAWAQDVSLAYGGKEVLVPGVASVLRSLLGSPSGGDAYYDGGDRTLRPTVEKLRGRGMASVGNPRRNGRNRQARDDYYEDYYEDYPPPQQSAPAPVNSGDQVRIEAERRLNAVIVRDTKDRMPYYEQIIAALDVEPQLVEIEAQIVDVNTDKALQLGVNYRFSNAGDEALFGRGDASDLRLRNGQNITPAGQGFFFSTVLGNSGNFVARVNALATEDAAKIVSRPQVVTMSNTEAIVEANRSFFVRVAGDYDVDLFNVNAGTTLRVTPHVLRETGQTPRIRLLVTVEDGSLTPAQVDQIPIVDRAAINTQALILEGESLLLGGLVRDEEYKSVRKVPLLGDVPILKYAFRYSTKNKTRVERLFLITPRLIPANRLAQPAAGAPPVSPGPAAGAPGNYVPPPLPPRQIVRGGRSTSSRSP